jgi:hypothetical protein
MQTSSAARIERAPFAPLCLVVTVNINDVLPGLDAIYTDLRSRPELEGRSTRPGIINKSKAAPERVRLGYLTNSDSGIGSSRGQTGQFSEKTARNRHFVETLLLECDIRMLEKLFN